MLLFLPNMKSSHYLGALKKYLQQILGRMLEYSAFSLSHSIIATRYFYLPMFSYKDFKILDILLKVGTLIA